MSEDGADHEFFAAFREAFGYEAPRTLRQSYSLLCQALYFGLHGGLGYDERPGGIASGKRYGADRWPFKDWRVLPLKTRVDKSLDRAMEALLRWNSTERS